MKEIHFSSNFRPYRLKLRWCSNNSERKKSAEILKEAAERKFSLCSITSSTTQSSHQAENSKGAEPSSKKRKALFEFMLKTNIIKMMIVLT